MPMAAERQYPEIRTLTKAAVLQRTANCPLEGRVLDLSQRTIIDTLRISSNKKPHHLNLI
jgi:hypothetical protein